MNAGDIEVYVPCRFEGEDRLCAISDVEVADGVAELRVIDFCTGERLGVRRYSVDAVPVERVCLFG